MAAPPDSRHSSESSCSFRRIDPQALVAGGFYANAAGQTVANGADVPAGGHQVTGLTLIRLNAGDIISIRNIGNIGDILQGGTDGQTPTSAMLSILKVG